MLHVLLKKLATEPALFVEHASAYVALATLEAQEAGRAWQRRVLAWLGCVVLGVMALAFTGLAGLLAAVVHWQQMPAPWVLVAVPALLWLLCGVLAWLASRPAASRPFMHLRQQWQVDAQFFSDAARPT